MLIRLGKCPDPRNIRRARACLSTGSKYDAKIVLFTMFCSSNTHSEIALLFTNGSNLKVGSGTLETKILLQRYKRYLRLRQIDFGT